LGHQLPLPLGVSFFLSKIIGDSTPKPADGFGGLTPNNQGIRGKLGVWESINQAPKNLGKLE
jgi:hypothetical protein